MSARRNPLFHILIWLVPTLYFSASAFAQDPEPAPDPNDGSEIGASGAEAEMASGPTPEQRQSTLLQEGSVALRMGDNATAIARFEELVALADLNIAHLNLSRALLNSGRCRESSAALARVFTAKASTQVPLSQILRDAKALREEMSAACPALVEVRCRPAEMELFVDGLGPLPCDGKAMILMPGKHTLRGQVGEYRTAETFDLAMMENKAIELVIERAQKVEFPDVSAAEKKKKAEVRPRVKVKRQSVGRLPTRIRRWVFGGRFGPLGGETQISRETFESFDDAKLKDASEVGMELFAGYRFSRRYQLHFGPKINVVPEFKVEGETPGFDPSGSMVDLNLFGMMTFPFGKSFALFGGFELGLSSLSEGEGQNLDGGNFGGFGGFSYAWSDSMRASLSLRSQAFALSNQADVLADETLIEVAGSRVSLALGLEFRP
jgi:hypothetical protein